MKSCSLCGNNFPELISAIVEGSMLEICEDCSKFGNVIEVKQPEIQEERRRTIQIQEPEELELIIKDFPNKIKEARELMGLKQEEIAKKNSRKRICNPAIRIRTFRTSFSNRKKIRKLIPHKINVQL